MCFIVFQNNASAHGRPMSTLLPLTSPAFPPVASSAPLSGRTLIPRTSMRGAASLPLGRLSLLPSLPVPSFTPNPKPPPRDPSRAKSRPSPFPRSFTILPSLALAAFILMLAAPPVLVPGSLLLDRWGDHALCCGGGGDRVLRHNAVRNIVCSAVAEFTSVSPELEKTRPAASSWAPRPRWHFP